ncbi:hypothetical protein C8E03_110109 [Lachnotalea glycerini]|uniref:Uncharacterized protein n=1 Tax=Lachnotalea glycerini TaxID=1763509 RepID=A0A318ELF2_9FIRM|nr:hypothetical protein [Lachnotalea glycerini]OYP35718.1 hypothetical protein CG709_06090 [Lachnotalea glycerini]PXV87348.1 hypothetical protein C8E03_110109 [Lachnotalea glycerini]
MKRARKLIVMVLVLTFLISTTCYAVYCKKISIDNYTRSYSTGTLQSNGDMLISLSTYQNYVNNRATLEVQRLVGNEWKTVKYYRKTLNVGCYTSYSYLLKDCGGTIRVVFTSDSRVHLEGWIQYFN